MAQAKKRGVKRKKPLIDTLPELLVNAIAKNHDFILTFETDPDTCERTAHVMTGKFISRPMLKKMIGQAESQKDEGSTLVSRKWAKAKARTTGP